MPFHAVAIHPNPFGSIPTFEDASGPCNLCQCLLSSRLNVLSVHTFPLPLSKPSRWPIGGTRQTWPQHKPAIRLPVRPHHLHHQQLLMSPACQVHLAPANHLHPILHAQAEAGEKLELELPVRQWHKAGEELELELELPVRHRHLLGSLMCRRTRA